MKNIFKFIILAVTLTASALFFSCSNDEPDGPVVPPISPNEFTFDGVSTELKSLVVDTEYTPAITYILLSQEEGLTTLDEVMAEGDDGEYLHKFLMIAVPTKNITDTNIDVMTETESFSFSNLSGVCDGFTSIMPGQIDEISAGTITVKAANDILTVDFTFDVVAGGVFAGHYSGAYATPVVPTTNILALQDNVLPVRSTFYDKADGGVSLYLTPSRISTARYLEDVNTYYVNLNVNNSLLTGEVVDITKTQGLFEFTLCIPMNAEKFTIGTNNLDGASGTFKVVERGTTGTYMIELDITIDGYHVTGNYDGAFVVYDITIPNEYILNGNDPVAIKSVVVDKTNAALYSIYVSGKSGVTTVAGMKAADANPIIVTANPNNFTGDYLGFSIYPDVSITCNGILHNSETDKAGNTKITLEPEKIAIDFELFKLENTDIALKGHYEGAYSSVSN